MYKGQKSPDYSYTSSLLARSDWLLNLGASLELQNQLTLRCRTTLKATFFGVCLGGAAPLI